LVGAVCELDQPSVRHVPVGIGITGTPVPKGGGAEFMPPCKLGVECVAGGVIIFHVLNVVRLRVESRAVGITVLDDSVIDVLPFKTVSVVLREEREIEQCAKFEVIGILVVGRFAEIYGAVVGHIVWPVKGILHIKKSAVCVREIYACQ